MDVVLQPIGAASDEWCLKDRLGRHLGKVRRSSISGNFEIAPEPTGKLQGVAPLRTSSLDAAMTTIAKHMGGTCELDSRDWG
jgi:hypothetical protein